MSNLTSRTIVTEYVAGCTISIEHDPNMHSYVITVSKIIRGQTYNIRTVLSEAYYDADKRILTDTLTQCVRKLEEKEKEIMIKENFNPSFRRKDYDKQNQDV